MAMNAPTATLTRNLGPSWGASFLLWAGQGWPRWIFRPLLKAGTWVGLAILPVQRAHSRRYLTTVFGRPARLVEVWRHFFALTENLTLMLRVGRGLPIRCVVERENAAGFDALLASDRPALFGTFHFGRSDLLGYLLSDRGRRVSILRLRVGNSTDTHLLGQRFAGKVAFLWVNNPGELLFSLKAALEAGDSIALKCDRVEFSAKNEPFHFLGAPRPFPFSIYHLAILFDRPVVFCTAVPGESEEVMRVFTSTVFTPAAAASRETNTRAARVHFQSVLTQLEKLVRADPYLWFNFLPLSPAAPTAAV